MTFTHNNVNDTTLERDGNYIVFTFVNDGFTYDTDTFDFSYSQDELLEMLGDYFDHKENADLFDDLTLPQQDALWNALLYLDKNHLEV